MLTKYNYSGFQLGSNSLKTVTVGEMHSHKDKFSIGCVMDHVHGRRDRGFQQIVSCAQAAQSCDESIGL